MLFALEQIKGIEVNTQDVRVSIRVLPRLPRPSVGTPRALPDRQAAQAHTLSLTARLSLGRVTVFTYSNLVHGPAEKGLPGQGRLFERIYAVGAYAKRPQRRKGRCDGMSLEGRRGIPGANLIYFQARPGQHADAGCGQSPAAVER